MNLRPWGAPLTKRARVFGDSETRTPKDPEEATGTRQPAVPGSLRETAFPQYWPFQQVHVAGPLTGRPENS